MRALTTSAGVPIIAPTNLKTFLIGLVMDQVSAWATFREEKKLCPKIGGSVRVKNSEVGFSQFFAIFEDILKCKACS